MVRRITRRKFATAGTSAVLALPVLETQGRRAAGGSTAMAVRPYQLMCIVCRLGAGRTGDLGEPRLTAILLAVRRNPRLPLSLRCNVDTVYRYQNPGHADDTPEGDLFNAKRDLDILQKLGLVPGDTRPAIDVFERLLAMITESRGICGYGTPESRAWRGCAQSGSGNYEKGRNLGVEAVIPARDPKEKAEYKTRSATAIYEAKALRIRPHHLLCMSCFHGGKDKLAPIAEDNLFEAIDAIQKRPDTPVTLIAGVCMICPPCGRYDPEHRLCLGGRSMALRDQKKDLDVLQRLGLEYGDTLPARRLFDLLYERIASTREVCGYSDGVTRAPEWSVCGGAEKDEAYRRARAGRLGISG